MQLNTIQYTIDMKVIEPATNPRALPPSQILVLRQELTLFAIRLK